MRLSLMLLALLSAFVVTGRGMAESLRQMSASATQADWEARLPVLIAVVLFVIVVDLAFVIPTLRKLNHSRSAASSR